MNLATPLYEEEGIMLYFANALTGLRGLDSESVQTVVTSPPYWGLRDYKTEAQVWDAKSGCNHEFGLEVSRIERRRSDRGLAQTGNGGPETRLPGLAEAGYISASQGAFCHCGAWRGSLGLEPTPELYVEHLIMIFREVRRVLKKDGTLWLNLGDCYYSGNRGGYDRNRVGVSKNMGSTASDFLAAPNRLPQKGLKDKDLVGIPWRVAFALQADGWWLRSDIIWAKPNPMPESVTDRPTRAHEYLFLLTKSAHYYYNAEAIKEKSSMESLARYERGRSDTHKWADGGPGNQTIARSFNGMKANVDKQRGHSWRHYGFNDRWDLMTKEEQCSVGRNKRSVWEIATQPYPEAHFATFPEALVAPCILAGSRPSDVILDPFVGSGTVFCVAKRLGRKAVGIELNAEYCQLALNRASNTMPALPFTEDPAP